MRITLLIAASCALAACSGSREPDAASNSDPALTENTTAPTPATTSVAAPIAAVPVAMRGRWGLVPADCTTTNGDEKGLVTIGPKNMRFYESVARLKTIEQGADGTIKARFAYSGEGMEWTRDTTLAVKDVGKTLVLEEFGDDAPKGAQTYTRCP